jgi:hypothetical protein
MEKYGDADELIRKLSILSKTDATKELTRFYAKARFRIKPDDFRRQYTDGHDDGGIDFCHTEDSTLLVCQTKFSGKPEKVAESDIRHELSKLRNTLFKQNPNKKADEFVNSVRRETSNNELTLEILWLTTNVIKRSVVDKMQEVLDNWKKEESLAIGLDFVAVDKNALDMVIYDVNHNYIPYTGKRKLNLEQGQWIEIPSHETGVDAIICVVNVNDIIKWFRNADDIDKFLQKNVREFLGETGAINRAISQSYVADPDWFWYKHNGIIIFTDNLSLGKNSGELILRNPQIVNGGQTVKAIFGAFDKNGRKDNGAKVALRIYRLPYEHAETYERSIQIISALNSQNKINPSDLHSMDPRQVRLEQLFASVGKGYTYLRKRSEHAKAGLHSITMRALSLRYYVCKKDVPHEGVIGNIEELFEEKTKYDQTFDENAIFKDISGNHVIMNYVTCWVIDQILQKCKPLLAKRDAEYFQYTKWHILADVYKKVLHWRQNKFALGWQMWPEFIECKPFENAVLDYSRSAFRICTKMLPAREEARKFLKTAEASKKFQAKTGIRKFESVMTKALTNFSSTS